jgi:hypothetical protein
MMTERLAALRLLISERFPESRLEPLSSDEFAAIKQQYPDIPDHLLDFYRTVGNGRVGKSRKRSVSQTADLIATGADWWHCLRASEGVSAVTQRENPARS